jgi:polysaccharide biosynthesis protein PslG
VIGRKALAAGAAIVGFTCVCGSAEATSVRLTPSSASAAKSAVSCSTNAVVHPLVARTDRAVPVRTVRNTFGTSLFGVAAGGGIQDESRQDMSSDVSAFSEVGGRWLRIDINWSSIQAAGPSSFSWGATDRVVREARRCGMQVLGGIYYTPAWARPAGTPPTWAPNPAAYGRFAYAAARHYRHFGVHTFEIWNEPNVARSFAPAANPAAYTALLKAADRGIKGANPHATVVTGGLSPSPTGAGDISPIKFLKSIYAHGGKRFFDEVGIHPYCSPAMPGARDTWSAWYQIYGTHPSLRSVMVSHGDRRKKVWATEFGAPTWGPAGTFVSFPTQAAMVTRAYQLWATYSWAGPLFVYSGRDQGHDNSSDNDWYGLLQANWVPKPSFDAYWAVSHALALAVRHARR